MIIKGSMLQFILSHYYPAASINKHFRRSAQAVWITLYNYHLIGYDIITSSNLVVSILDKVYIIL